MRTTTFVTLLAAQSALVAQSAVVPAAYANKDGGRAYAIPFSYGAYLRHQQLIETKEVKVGPITGLGFRSRTRVLNVRDRAWQELLVQLSHSPNTLANMSTTYASNHGADLRTVFNGKMDLYKMNTGAPLEFNCVVPFSAPFVALQTGPLVVDLYPQNNGYEFNTGCPQGGNGTGMDFAQDPLMRSVSAAKSSTCTNTPPNTMAGAGLFDGGYVLKMFYNGDLMPYGHGCSAPSPRSAPVIGNTGGGAAVGNGNFAITLAGAHPAANVAFFLMGLTNRQTPGNTRLPIDLSFLAAPGCWQNHDALFGLFVPMVGGATQVNAPIPNNNALRGVEVFAQFASDETTSGLVTTQGGLIKVQ